MNQNEIRDTLNTIPKGDLIQYVVDFLPQETMQALKEAYPQ